jgi:hypothetical protein
VVNQEDSGAVDKHMLVIDERRKKLESLDISVISFHVRYGLWEYMRLASAHVMAELARRKQAEGKPLRRTSRWTLHALLWLVCPPIFLFKSLRVGACDFTIDKDGLVRRSKSGEIVVPWADVVAVHRYPDGYLIAKENGAMPIPFRVLSARQRRDLKALLAHI